MQKGSGADPDPVTSKPIPESELVLLRAERAEQAAKGLKRSGNLKRKVRAARNVADKLGRKCLSPTLCPCGFSLSNFIRRDYQRFTIAH